MRTFFTSFLLAISLLSVNAQEQNTQEYGSSLKRTGIILTSIGAPVFVGGIALGIATGGFSYQYENTNGQVTETGEPINGLAGMMTLTGGLSTGAGIVLIIMGNNEIKRQKGLSFNVKPNNVNLCYRF